MSRYLSSLYRGMIAKCDKPLSAVWWSSWY